MIEKPTSFVSDSASWGLKFRRGLLSSNSFSNTPLSDASTTERRGIFLLSLAFACSLVLRTRPSFSPLGLLPGKPHKGVPGMGFPQLPPMHPKLLQWLAFQLICCCSSVLFSLMFSLQDFMSISWPFYHRARAHPIFPWAISGLLDLSSTPGSSWRLAFLFSVSNYNLAAPLLVSLPSPDLLLAAKDSCLRPLTPRQLLPVTEAAQHSHGHHECYIEIFILYLCTLYRYL